MSFTRWEDDTVALLKGAEVGHGNACCRYSVDEITHENGPADVSVIPPTGCVGVVVKGGVVDVPVFVQRLVRNVDLDQHEFGYVLVGPSNVSVLTGFDVSVG